MDHDDFYSHLPFTLTPQQTTPQYVILGTGLQECLIAAYKSKSEGKSGLIIDIDRTYGSSLKTVSLKEFHQLSSGQSEQKMYRFITPQSWLTKNKNFYEECIASNKYRGYNMDIEPNFFFASSITCQCLKDADMDKYMDFHLVNNILHIDSGSFQPVPLSKGKIFESKGLSLLQKKTLLMSIHKLIKIYHKWMKLQQDINSTKQFDKGFGDIQESLYKQFEESLANPFNTFLQKLTKKNKKIINYLTYIICNYQYNYTQPVPDFAKYNYSLRGFIQRFGKFIKSCGIYGQSPYLYVDNGIGDIPQSFSRIASIYGSTYILHPKITIDAIQSNEQGLLIRSNLSPQLPIKTKQLFFGPTYLHLTEEQSYYSEHNLRVLLLCEKNGKEQACPGICYLNDFPSFQNPVYLFMFDNSTQSCPQEYIIYQFQTIISSEQAEDPSLSSKSEIFLKVLTDIYGEGFIDGVKYFSSYVRTRRYPKQTASLKDKVLLNDTMGIDLDQHFLNFVSVVGEKDHYFKKDVKGDQQQQPFGGYETNYILQKLQEINLNEPINKCQVKVQQNQKQQQNIPQITHQEVQEKIQDKQ